MWIRWLEKRSKQAFNDVQNLLSAMADEIQHQRLHNITNQISCRHKLGA